MIKLTVKEIQQELISIISDEMNQSHFINLRKSNEIALISTDTDVYKKFQEWLTENNLFDSGTIYLTGEHKELIIDTMIYNYDKSIETKRNLIKNGI